jgi:Flp pilus assembly protein TadG
MLQQAPSPRRGTIAILTAVLLIPLLGMIAFAVDIGWISLAQSELQNAADASALAGAKVLGDSYNQYVAASGNQQTTITNTAIANAKTAAKNYASYNTAGTVTSLVLNDGDIEFGFTDAKGVYTAMPSYSGFPNTIKVKLRLDNQANGALKLFFAPVLGTNSESLTANSGSTIYTGTITSFQSIGVNGSLLPIAVDVNTWTDFYNNGASSAYVDDNSPPGTPWFTIYPGGTGTCQNGLLSLNGSKAASQQFYSGGPPSGGWIQCGATSSDITSLQSAGDLPADPNNPAAWAAGPGMKSSLLSDFQALVTSPPTLRILPLFDPNSSNTTGGGNGTYAIVRFVPVYLVYADGHGKANMDIAVVPAYTTITDPTAVISSVAPAGASTTPAPFQVPVPAKLTQ